MREKRVFNKKIIKNKQDRHRGTLLRPDSLSVSPPIPTISRQELLHYARRYEGKLLLQEEYALSTSIFTLLVNQRIITPISSIKKTFLSTTCIRCHNKQSYLFATIPCARCLKSHLYCRSCIQMGRVMECTMLYQWIGAAYPWPKHQQPCTWQGTLTDAQQYAAKKMIHAIQTNQKLLTWAVTGSGKTEMLFPSITTALQMGKRICIATPRADVVRELLPRLQQAFQNVSVQGLYGGSRDNDGTAQLIVATTHQLLRFQRAFDVLIIDEIDAFPYHQDPTLQMAAKRARKTSASTLYLTATPKRKQRQAMARRQLDYVFVPIRFHRQPLPTPIFQHCFILQKELQNNNIPKAFIQWFRQRHVPSRQLLVFVPTVHLAKGLVTSLAKQLIQEGWITTEREVTFVHAADEEREEKVTQFRQKKYMVLITTTILERGVTFPALDVIVLDAGHQVFDVAALIQIAGRAGRSAVDPKGEVVFFHDGKTNSMVQAQIEIIKMNKRAKQFTLGDTK